MQTIALNVHRVDPKSTTTNSELQSDLRRARLLANWLDAKFNVGGIRFGLDGIVGLVPVVGDALTGAAALYPLYVAYKHDLGSSVITKMGVNVAVDFLAGSVSLIGDLVDVAFKANQRNVALLEEAAKRRS